MSAMTGGTAGLQRQEPLLGPGAQAVLAAGAAAGAVTFLAALAFEPSRAWGAWLAGAYWTVALTVGAALFVAMNHLTGAGWSAAIRRVPETLALFIPLGAAALLTVLAGLSHLYPWSRPEVLAASPLVAGKSPYLNVPFFTLRMLVFLTAWAVLARAMVRTSLGDRIADPLERVRRARTWSAVLAVTFALTYTLAGFDWILSLEPTFYSTVFPFYGFCGMVLGATALVTVTVVLLHRSGRLPGLREEHLHDLGKVLATFSTLWAYAWLSQYLLIWYTNMPEETVWYLARQEGVWGVLWILNLLLNWALPFALLLPRAAKRSGRMLLIVSVIVLAGRWVDILHLIMPPLQSEPGIGWIEAAVPLALPLTLVLLYVRRLDRTRLHPEEDPLLTESLTYHA